MNWISLWFLRENPRFLMNVVWNQRVVVAWFGLVWIVFVEGFLAAVLAGGGRGGSGSLPVLRTDTLV